MLRPNPSTPRSRHSEASSEESEVLNSSSIVSPSYMLNPGRSSSITLDPKYSGIRGFPGLSLSE
jgi:hypothetical protein